MIPVSEATEAYQAQLEHVRQAETHGVPDDCLIALCEDLVRARNARWSSRGFST